MCFSYIYFSEQISHLVFLIWSLRSQGWESHLHSPFMSFYLGLPLPLPISVFTLKPAMNYVMTVQSWDSYNLLQKSCMLYPPKEHRRTSRTHLWHTASSFQWYHKYSFRFVSQVPKTFTTWYKTCCVDRWVFLADSGCFLLRTPD